MNFKKTLLVAALSAASFCAQASTITVGGVTWDPDYSAGPPTNLVDFTGQHKFLQWYSAADVGSTPGLVPNATVAVNPTVGSYLTGVGYIDQINTSGETGFINGRLSYVFGGFQISSLVGGIPLFTGGWINVYSDTSAPVLANNYNNYLTQAASGTLWLSLTARSVAGTSLTFTAGSILNGSVEGLFDVTGGLAAGNFNTNSQLGGADVYYSGDARFAPGSKVSQEGNGAIQANSIPEPASLALVGLGLLGAAALRRRKAA